MSNKTIIITGANSGIGKDAAYKFANAGYTVIMACRNIEKSEKIKNEIVNQTNNHKVFLREVDMSSMNSIAAFCSGFIQDFSKLDVLINNAAYFNHGEGFNLSIDGIEITFATNVLGTFLITNMLTESLTKSDDARVINAGSNIIKHFFNPKKELRFDNLNGIPSSNFKHSVYDNYRNSKMTLLMLTFKMSQIFKKYNIKVNAIQINGAKMSNDTLKKFTPIWRILASIQNLFFPEPGFMAESYFELGNSEKFSNSTGKYFNHKLEEMMPGPSKIKIQDIIGTKYYPDYAQNNDMRDKIWTICNNMTDKFL